MGFDYFYGFMGGETDQWTPWLFQNTTQIFPWVGHPGYNLITDMADEAIKYLRDLNNAAPDKPFFLYYVPGGSHAPHQPTPEWIKKISDMHLFDKGWNDAARADLRQSEAARRGSREYPTHALAGSDKPNSAEPSSRNGTRSVPTKRSSSSVRRTSLPPTRLIPIMRSAA